MQSDIVMYCSQEFGLITQHEICELATRFGQRTITHFSVSLTCPPEDEMLNVKKIDFLAAADVKH